MGNIDDKDFELLGDRINPLLSFVILSISLKFFKHLIQNVYKDE